MRAIRTIRASAFAFAATASWCALARAQPKTPESSADWPLQIDDCAPELASALPSVVRLEVDVLLRERAPAAPPDQVDVQCSGDGARIAVSLHGATRDTSVDLSQLAARHRPRALALATAELLHALSNRDDSAARPVAAAVSPPSPRLPPPAPPSAPKRAPPARVSRPAALLVGALAEWLGQPATPLFGARIALHYPVSALFVPALSAHAAFGSASVPSARVGAKTFGAATHLYFQAATQHLRLAAGPGARIGWAQLSGHPSAESMLDGRTLSGVWGGPEARARLAYATTTERSPLLAIELGAGIVTLPLRGELDGTEAVYALKGPWLSLCLEVGLEL